MSYIDPTSSSAGPAGTATGTPASSGANASGLNQLDNSQTFLDLLVAQLKNQDPSNPTDPTSFMTEIAQLTSVQSQTSLDAEEQTVAADSMLGQTVTGIDSAGQTVSGTVSSVMLPTSGGPELQLAGKGGNLSLDQVSQVYGAPAATAAKSPSSTSTSTSTPVTTTTTPNGSIPT